MAGTTYWIDVFTPQTWHEFLAAGGEVSGFPHRMRKTVASIREGDVLLCYVAGVSRWIGALEVVGTRFVDDTPIWSGDRAFTERIRVRPLITLELETAIPAVSLRDEMPLFQNLSNPNHWSIHFRRSPSKLSSEDGAVVMAALDQALRDPIARPIPKSKLPVDIPMEEPSDEDPATFESESASEPTGLGTDHTEMQWMLLTLGEEMGLSVWAPKADRSKGWNGHQPADVRSLLDELPAQFSADAMRTIGNIDVLWLDGDTFAAAFEIENSTSVYSGLLRMADLLALVPNLSIPLYVVAPDERRTKVFREVNRPTFNRLQQPLKDVCHYIAYSSIRDGYEAIKPYASSVKPSVVQQWAEVCDLRSEDQ